MNTPPTNITIFSGTTHVVLNVWLVDPRATTVVFYPGTMAGAMYYQLLLEQLVVQGFNVVGLNPVSHGDSPRSKVLFTFDDIVQNGKDAVLWARQHLQGPVVIAGHSQGGIAALAHAMAPQVATDHASPAQPAPAYASAQASASSAPCPPPPLAANTDAGSAASSAATPDVTIDAAFLLCTILPQHPRAIELTLYAPLATWRVGLLRGINKLARWLPWLPIVVPMYLSLAKIFRGGRGAVRSQGHMRAFYPLIFLASLFSADLSTATRKGGVNCPVSLISACNDALFTPDLLSPMWDAIKAPSKQRIVLSGGGHLAPFVPHYATEIAIHMAERCTKLGLALHPPTQHNTSRS